MTIRFGKVFWPVVGLAAVVVSIWLLVHELRGTSLEDVRDGLAAIPTHGWLLSAASAIAAYGALAGYDRIALNHLRRKVPLLFVALCSFTTYALSHNIGGSVLSGAVIRYRAYASQGLSVQDVGTLVAFCSFTFALSTVLLSSLVLIGLPDLIGRYHETASPELSIGLGVFGLLLVAAYVIGSVMRLKPRRIGKFWLHYPRLRVVLRQLTIGPAELLAAAAIIYFVLPEAGNPGYLTILGIFLISFSAAQLSHAPGGLGVLEVVFLTGLSDMDEVAVLAALLVFRLLYLIIPLILGLFVVVLFEKTQFGRD